MYRDVGNASFLRRATRAAWPTDRRRIGVSESISDELAARWQTVAINSGLFRRSLADRRSFGPQRKMFHQGNSAPAITIIRRHIGVDPGLIKRAVGSHLVSSGRIFAIRREGKLGALGARVARGAPTRVTLSMHARPLWKPSRPGEDTLPGSRYRNPPATRRGRRASR